MEEEGVAEQASGTGQLRPIPCSSALLLLVRSLPPSLHLLVEVSLLDSAAELDRSLRGSWSPEVQSEEPPPSWSLLLKSRLQEPGLVDLVGLARPSSPLLADPAS